MQPFLENDSLVQVIKVHPEILQQMLSTVLNIIMFEDCRNQWSMSRPLLGLILLNEEYFKQLRDQVSILILESSLNFFLHSKTAHIHPNIRVGSPDGAARIFFLPPIQGTLTLF